MLAQKITFDLMQSKLDDIRVVQGDSCREIQFEGSDLDGVLSYDDYTYEFDLMKSDGTFVIQTLSAGILIPSEQMEVITGTHYYNVKIKDADNELVYSGQGAFIVDDNVITEDAIESVAEVNGLIFPDDFLTVNDNVAFIDDDTVSEDSTWSSQKIQEEIDNNTPAISKTASGNPLTFTDGANAPMVNCAVTISPQQDLHGYDKPWVGGAGKNKLPYTSLDGTYGRGVVVKTNDDGSISFNGTPTETFYITALNFSLSQGTYTFSRGSDITSAYDLYVRIINVDTSSNIFTLGNSQPSATFTLSATTNLRLVIFTAEISAISGKIYPMIEEGSTATSYEPYDNICHISGYSAVDVNVAESVLDTPQTYTINLGGTYYSGQIDAVKGVLVATHKGVVYNGTETGWRRSGTYQGSYYINSNYEISDRKINTPFLCDQAEYVEPGDYVYGTCCATENSKAINFWLMGAESTLADWTTYLSNNPMQVVYELETPLEITLTPTVINSLLGNNTMWTDGDNMSVEYITAPYQPLIDSISQLI